MFVFHQQNNHLLINKVYYNGKSLTLLKKIKKHRALTLCTFYVVIFNVITLRIRMANDMI